MIVKQCGHLKMINQCNWFCILNLICRWCRHYSRIQKFTVDKGNLHLIVSLDFFYAFFFLNNNISVYNLRYPHTIIRLSIIIFLCLFFVIRLFVILFWRSFVVRLNLIPAHLKPLTDSDEYMIQITVLICKINVYKFIWQSLRFNIFFLSS